MKIGDLLYATWGYDQTNVDFYQVVSVTPKTVTLREVKRRLSPSASSSEDKVSGVQDTFAGEPFTRKRHPHGDYEYVRISHHTHAYKWDGKAIGQTSSYAGH